MILCTINNRKYRCLLGKEYVTFIDVNDKGCFLTVASNGKLSQLLKHPFFRRK